MRNIKKIKADLYIRKYKDGNYYPHGSFIKACLKIYSPSLLFYYTQDRLCKMYEGQCM